MAAGDRLNTNSATEVKTKAQSGKAVSGNEIIEAVAVEGSDGLPSLKTEAGPAPIPGFNIPPHDHITLAYKVGGNGDGEIETVVYRLGGAGGTVVATLTLTYDANDNILTITKA